MISRAKWHSDLKEMMCSTPLPTILVACPENFVEGDVPPSRNASMRPLRERIVGANRAWLELLAYEESQIVDRSFAGIPGFQGELTSEESKLQLAMLLISKERSVSSIRVVNYTGRSRVALDLELSIRIFKQGGRNIFFLCSITSHRPVAGSTSVGREPQPSSLRPRENIRVAQQLDDLHRQLRAACQPSMLVGRCDAGAGSTRLLKESILGVNQMWCDLMEREEAQVINKAFSQIPGLQGPLTSDSAKLILASLLVSDARGPQHVSIVNYTRRTKEPIELRLSVEMFKRSDGQNAYFLSTVESFQSYTVESFQRLSERSMEWSVPQPAHASVPEVSAGMRSPRPQPQVLQQPADLQGEQLTSREQPPLDNEPEPEEQQCAVSHKGSPAEEQLVTTLRDLMKCTQLPCILAKAGGERVMYGNDAWQALFPGALAFCRHLSDLFNFETQERVVTFRVAELLHTQERSFKKLSATCKLDHRVHPLALTLNVDIYRQESRGESLRFFLCTVADYSARSVRDLQPPAEQRSFSKQDVRPAFSNEADLNDDINADITHSVSRFSRQSSTNDEFETASVCSFATVSEPVEEPGFSSLYESALEIGCWRVSG